MMIPRSKTLEHFDGTLVVFLEDPAHRRFGMAVAEDNTKIVHRRLVGDLFL
jgi:hypothetical protein